MSSKACNVSSKQGYDQRIRQWISEVREVAQDAEDAIEIFSLKLDTQTKNRGLLARCARFSVHVSHFNRVGEEIHSIRTRLHEIRERRDTYGIGNLGIESSSRSSSETVELRRRMVARFQKDKDVVGLNGYADLLLNKVILDEKRKGLSLAAIVGMGGIGKSTLARKIYNHPEVAAGFEKRAWVVVSSEFAAEDIMKQIMHDLSLPLGDEELKALESIQGKLRRQEMLQQMLRNRLEGKRYFIVLDDVWEYTHWKALETAFPDEQDKASRLVFTSRNQIITEHRGYVHKMKLLNSNESWELLLKTALISRRCPQVLEEIGREILKKCQGLPLTITVAGGLLMNQGESKTGWEKVLKQIKKYGSETSEIGTSVSAILELSYQNLPSHLKPCFLCVAFFKEDAVIEAKRLMHIWVALGLVQAGEESVEEIARRYLDELIHRNIVLVKRMSIDDRATHFYVHDLLRELSIRKAVEEIGFESQISEESSSSSKPRHRVIRGVEKVLIQIQTSNQNKHLRTLFLHVEGPNDDAFTITPSYWKGLELLRILDIEGSMLWRFPPKIRALIGLRYLRLRDKYMICLPSWLDVLKNLEILDIGGDGVVEFPDVTWKMDSLRHIYINAYCSDFTKSMKKSSFKNLETLKWMRSDNVLLGFSYRLRKLGLKMEDEGEAVLVRLSVETRVQVVHLRWSVWNQRVHTELSILKSLDHLTKLKLHGHMDLFVSAYMLPQNITHLTLSHFGNPNNPMHELGKLPKLLFLKLDHSHEFMESIKVSHEGFPRLKVLHLRNMSWLENIEIEEGGMPELQRLEIHQCRNLWGLENLGERIRPAEIIIIDH